MKNNTTRKKIYTEVDNEHARERFHNRFSTSINNNVLTPQELIELRRRYNKLNSATHVFDDAVAVVLYALNRHVDFYQKDLTSSDTQHRIDQRGSNGNVIWAVVRWGEIKTVFARRGEQNFYYWADPHRGNVKSKNILYINNKLEIKRLPHNEYDTTSQALSRVPDFYNTDINQQIRESYRIKLLNILEEVINELLDGATMNTSDKAAHNKKLNKLKKVMKTQGNDMIEYPDLANTVVGVPWKQLLDTPPE